MDVDRSLSALFGSDTRLRLLAVLANAQHPLTGYRVAKTAEVPISKVYPELSRLEKARLAAHTKLGWTIDDTDVAALLRKRMRVVDSEDWFRNKSNRDEQDRALMDRLRKLPPPDWSTVNSTAIRYDLSRRKEKDALLARHGMKPSATHGRKRVR